MRDREDLGVGLGLALTKRSSRLRAERRRASVVRRQHLLRHVTQQSPPIRRDQRAVTVSRDEGILIVDDDAASLTCGSGLEGEGSNTKRGPRQAWPHADMEPESSARITCA